MKRMIYPTLAECLEECRNAGVLRAEGMAEDEYVFQRVGFKLWVGKKPM